MQIQVKPDNSNAFPLGAVLIKGTSAYDWLQEMQQMNMPLHDCDCYAVPGLVANSVYGCLLILKKKVTTTGRHSYYQNIDDRIFIPEHSNLYPHLNTEELQQLFRGNRYMFHPETGWAELEETIDWASLLEIPTDEDVIITTPKEAPFSPQQIKLMEVHALPPDEALEQLAKDAFPHTASLKDEPLSVFEKIKLFLLRLLFKQSEDYGYERAEPSSLTKMADKLTRMFSNKPSNWIDGLERDYKNLEDRSKEELQKLMDLFKKNPEEALKYAIPIDHEGLARGSVQGGYSMQQLWSNFSIFGGGGYGGKGGSIDIGADNVQRLHAQYHKTAQDLIKKGDYEKAAFIYLKLLKNYTLAAETLEQGSMYGEAAALYLKHTKNKHRAAECYEKGRMYSQAIELYKELEEHEKTGDLYLQIGEQQQAFQYYGKVIETHRQGGKYVQASLLYRNKMNDKISAQDMLRDGWRMNRDAFNCLNLYLANIEDKAALEREIETFYTQETNDNNKETFVTVLKHEYEKHPELRQRTREMAYEIIAEQSDKNVDILTMLKHFNEDDGLIKDILRYKSKARY